MTYRSGNGHNQETRRLNATRSNKAARFCATCAISGRHYTQLNPLVCNSFAVSSRSRSAGRERIAGLAALVENTTAVVMAEDGSGPKGSPNVLGAFRFS